MTKQAAPERTLVVGLWGARHRQVAQDSYGEDLTDVAVVEMVGYDGEHAGSVLYAQLCHQTQGHAHSFLSGYTGGRFPTATCRIWHVAPRVLTGVVILHFASAMTDVAFEEQSSGWP